jgi:hypothetical protein
MLEYQKTRKEASFLVNADRRTSTPAVRSLKGADLRWMSCCSAAEKKMNKLSSTLGIKTDRNVHGVLHDAVKLSRSRKQFFQPTRNVSVDLSSFKAASVSVPEREPSRQTGCTTRACEVRRRSTVCPRMQVKFDENDEPSWAKDPS